MGGQETCIQHTSNSRGPMKIARPPFIHYRKITLDCRAVLLIRVAICRITSASEGRGGQIVLICLLSRGPVLRASFHNHSFSESRIVSAPTLVGSGTAFYNIV